MIKARYHYITVIEIAIAKDYHEKTMGKGAASPIGKKRQLNGSGRARKYGKYQCTSSYHDRRLGAELCGGHEVLSQ